MGECLDKSKLLLISPKVEVVFEVEVELGKYFLILSRMGGWVGVEKETNAVSAFN